MLHYNYSTMQHHTDRMFYSCPLTYHEQDEKRQISIALIKHFFPLTTNIAIIQFHIIYYMIQVAYLNSNKFQACVI